MSLVELHQNGGRSDNASGVVLGTGPRYQHKLCCRNELKSLCGEQPNPPDLCTHRCSVCDLMGRMQEGSCPLSGEKCP